MVSMSTSDPNTTAAPASTTTAATAATTTKKPASLKAVTGFGKLDPNILANTAHIVAKGVGGNPQYFGNPPVDPAALDASATTLSAAILAAMDGGKNAKTIRKFDLRNPADSQAIENSGRILSLFFGCRFRQEAKKSNLAEK
jgi:hypothetical protein